MGRTAFASKEGLFAWGMVWTMLAPVPKRDRPVWDEQTTAAMKRIGVLAQPPKPATAAAGKVPVEGFRLMEIIHIFDEDRCR